MRSSHLIRFFIGLAAVSLFSASADSVQAGQLYLVTSGKTHTVLKASSVGEQFGSTLATGDFNGDGAIDIAIGSPLFSDEKNPERGKVTIRYGKIDTVLTVYGASAKDRFGTSIVFGDLNNDDIDDLIVGAPYSGKVYVLFGKPQFYQTELDIGVYGPNIILIAEEPSDRFGLALDMFDFNEDGIKDLFIGAPMANEANYKKTGKIYMVFGRNYFPERYVKNFGYEQPDIVFLGERVRERLGTTLAHGDLNGDGKIDLIAAGYRTNAGFRKEAGKVSVFFGRVIASGFPSAGPLTIITPSVKFLGASPYDWLGYSLASADLNRDGISDLLMTSFSVKAKGRHGSLSVMFGRENFSAIPEIDLKKKRADIFMKSSRFPMTLGSSVAVNDVDRDDWPDLVIGVTSLKQPGRVYIYRGAELLKRSYIITERTLPDQQVFGARSGDWLGTSLAFFDRTLVVSAPFADEVYMLPLSL